MAKQTHINIGGTWAPVTNVWVNVGGTWQEKEVPFVNDGGTWKACMQYLLSTEIGISFDGVDDRADFNSNLDGTTYIEFLVQLPANVTSEHTGASQGPLLSKNEDDTRRVWLGSFDGSITDETLSIIDTSGNITFIKDTIPGNQQVKIVLNWNGSEWEFFIDDVQKTTFNNGAHAGTFSGMNDIGHKIGGTISANLEFDLFYLRTEGAANHIFLIDEESGNILNDTDSGTNDITINGPTWITI